MEPLAIANGLTGTAALGSGATAEKAKTTLNSDFETFLKMLTAQMKNQDPLNPVESTEFASQLAAFSTVEQQVLTNDLLTGLGTQMGVLGMGQLQGWVGMEARVKMPVAYDGAPVALTLETRPGADLARLVVRDATGGIVHESSVPATGGAYSWHGLGEDGMPLESGTYSISVDSFQGDELLGSDPVASQARVVEARLSDGQTMLVMEGGQIVGARDVLGLRQPDAG
ncbi:flagellar basal-body rod modification protein FlgD [Roseovarius nanhaiticus]|uniref:Basal-body rod modification protein FlgD n=1 Tax=Roseovarius nanhaiticus TaxID=573024 RepID=A0A1N7HL75_9RHOB|nr:flagellar hook capping FlgD N-terminal domain-containing protein [Roseovarius nanhaiticus]SEL26397.1 flagellar basal-body rod modification protein FlgD [Roseovarius nanhaiticus]SIS25448.1 flagellar basal-body rod modification protein FlgD [Roseovarius nanhaiticus]